MKLIYKNLGSFYQNYLLSKKRSICDSIKRHKQEVKKIKPFHLNKFQSLVESVKKFGITSFSPTEIEEEKQQFENEGLDINIPDILSTNNGELITVLKDGSIRKTIIHIVDISSWRENWGHPRFHIYSCEKIKEMLDKGKKHRYKASSRKTGRFFLIKGKKEWEKSLTVCSFCLTMYNKQFNFQKTKQSFPLKEYIEKPIKHLGFSDISLDDCTVPNIYTNSWPKISRMIKERGQYICSFCKKDFSNSECRKFLDTHHINADKRNNITENLKVLCIKCHSEEHNHSHIKKSKRYEEYLNSDCPKT